MGNFNNRSGGGGKPFRKPSFGGGRGGFGGGGNRGGFGGPRHDDRGEREMFTATCADCGNDCQVPFRPNGTKPVYCNNCFQRDEQPRFDGPKRDFAPPRPRPEHGVFAPKPAPAAGNYGKEIAELKTQIEILHSKIDRIIKLVSPVVTIEPVVDDVAPVAKAKTAKKKAAK